MQRFAIKMTKRRSYPTDLTDDGALKVPNQVRHSTPSEWEEVAMTRLMLKRLAMSSA